MYDNNGYPQQYYTTDPNGQYGNPYGENPYGGYNRQPDNNKPPKKKKVSGGLIAFLLIGAMAVGGASGFGGSILANRMNSSVVEGEHTDDGSNQKQPEETQGSSEEVTQPPHVAPEIPVNDDLSGLSNMAAMNTSTKYDYEELYKAVNESIVIVTNYVKNGYGNDGEYTKAGVGSGVIFTTDGYIVTNEHVVSGAEKITVTVEDKYSKNEEVEATVIGQDQATDLAVLKISRSQPYTAVPLGNSDSLNIGQQVCAIGNPAGLSKTLTGGYISGLNRYTSDKGYVLSSVQTDAAINPGNSGGGLFDMYGNVIGIVNSKIVASDSSIENLGFAITINEAKPIISDLINYGFVKGRPILGISAKPVNQYNGYSATGLLVAKIDQDAPIAQSELKVDDIIVEINGKAITDVEDVQEVTKGMKAGDKITVKVVRTVKTSGGYFPQTSVEEHTFEVILTENH